jgi:hypothetical protein
MHLARPHPDEGPRLVCKICDRDFENDFTFGQHIDFHFNKKLFVCNVMSFFNSSKFVISYKN